MSFNPLVRNSADFFSPRTSCKYVPRVKKYIYSLWVGGGYWSTFVKEQFAHKDTSTVLQGLCLAAFLSRKNHEYRATPAMPTVTWGLGY